MEIYALIILSFLLITLFFFYLKQKKEIALHLQESSEIQEMYTNVMAQKNELDLKYAVLNTKYENEINSSQEKIEILQNARDELALEFKNLSNKIFEQKSKQFGDINKEQMELLLKPFREQISNFSKQTRDQFEVEIKERHLLKNELLRLKEMNAQLSQEALNLTRALKSENKTQGNWGEIILANILEQSGLREGAEYELQASLKNSNDKMYRPDVIIHMPQERDIVIDSKVSLVAYERFVNAADETQKKKALQEHIRSIAMHIKGLSAKEYEKLEGIHSLDFVLLFMPIEGAFSVALQEDEEFFKRAYENNILVVSPSTLLVTLRTIEHIWRTQKQEEHANKIAKEAEAMYDKLVLFVDEMQNIGAYLKKSQDAYDKAMNRLSSGKGNVIKRAEDIKALGLKPKKELPILSGEE